MKMCDAMPARLIFNVQPLMSFPYDLEKHEEVIADGFASHIDTTKDYAILVFKNVDDHVDGAGISALWLAQGEGEFWYDGVELSVVTGDVVVFDDRVEHSFLSDDYCVGVNFTMRAGERDTDLAARINAINSIMMPAADIQPVWPFVPARPVSPTAVTR